MAYCVATAWCHDRASELLLSETSDAARCRSARSGSIRSRMCSKRCASRARCSSRSTPVALGRWRAGRRCSRPRLLPSAQHVISYHVLTEGRCWGARGEAPIALEAGDILVLPQGDAYWMALAPEQPRGDGAGEARVPAQGGPRRAAVLRARRRRRGAAGSGLLCGFLGCDLLPFNPLLATLPRILRVPSDGAAGTRGWRSWSRSRRRSRAIRALGSASVLAARERAAVRGSGPPPPRGAAPRAGELARRACATRA